MRRCKSKSWTNSKISRYNLCHIGTTQQKSLHFLYININSLLSNKDETGCIANKTKAVITGITESKLDHAVPDSEVNLPGYILR